MSIPSARINSDAPAFANLRAFGERLIRAMVAALLVGLAFAASQVGCRNDAITYAKTIYPEAHCSAINTCAFSCRYEVDIAICQVGQRRLQCMFERTDNNGPSCREVVR